MDGKRWLTEWEDWRRDFGASGWEGGEMRDWSVSLSGLGLEVRVERMCPALPSTLPCPLLAGLAILLGKAPQHEGPN